MEVSTTPSRVTSLGGPAPTPGGAYDLGALGYVEEEFLLEGEASSFALLGERTADGQWRAKPAESAPFTTRLVTRRPVDAGRFSGSVFVEWNNVSGGVDASPDWTLLHRQLIRAGHAWMGVTAQKAGIDGGGFVEGPHLKKTFPERYGALSHPGDAWSFDIFSQAGSALKRPSGLLGSLHARRLIAVGESQSAMFLVSYINAVDPLAKVYDGFFVHGRGASGAGFDGVRRRPSLADAPGERVREDARVPVLVLQSETDVTLLGGGRPRQPDGPRVRLWEIAGAAHADTYIIIAGAQDDGRAPPERLAELMTPTRDLMIGQTASLINAGPQQHYVGEAAIEALDLWVAGGPAPATAPRLELTADGAACALDRLGNAKGGVRSPWVDAPTAVLSGLGQSGGAFGFLFGTTTPFDSAMLKALYPGGKADYLAKFTSALDDAIAGGFILEHDSAEIMGLAAATYPPE
ncbi:MAG: alpha/beta hydrolase domain-containing protein [Caulobacterales bacterium]